MTNSQGSRDKKDITRIRLRVEAEKLFNTKELESSVSCEVQDKVKEFCEMKNQGEKWVGGQPLESFTTEIDPDEIIVWTPQIKGNKKEYKIALDLARIRASSSYFFDEVVQLGNKGVILAKAKSTFPESQEGTEVSEPYELWFTITKTDGVSGEIQTKTYQLDPKLKPTGNNISYHLIRSCIGSSVIPETHVADLLKLIDQFESPKGMDE